MRRYRYHHFARALAAAAVLVASLLVLTVRISYAGDCSQPSDCQIVADNADRATGIVAVGVSLVVAATVVRRLWVTRGNGAAPVTEDPDPCAELRAAAAAGAAQIAILEASVEAAKMQAAGGEDMPAGRPPKSGSFNPLVWVTLRPWSPPLKPSDIAPSHGEESEKVRSAEEALEAEREAQARRLAALADCERTQQAPERTPLPDLTQAIDDLERQFEEQQKALRHEVGTEMEQLQTWLTNYDTVLAKLLKDLDDYLRVSRILQADPDLTALWQARGDMQWWLDVARTADTAVQIAQVLLPMMGEMAAAMRAEGAVQEAVALEKQMTRLEAEMAQATGARKGLAGIDEAITRNRLQKEILDEIKDVNFLAQGEKNCVSCAIATDKTLGGTALQAMPDFVKEGVPKGVPGTLLQDYYGAKFQGVLSRDQLEGVMKEFGPGSRGVVWVKFEDGGAHAFNVINRDGHVFFPDGQTGGFFSQWDQVKKGGTYIGFLKTG